MERIDVVQAAAKGAAHLDEVRPGWANEIDLDKLDQTNGSVCVLGQLYEGFGRGLDELGIQSPQTEQLGFTVKWDPDALDHAEEWHKSTEAWKREIEKRLDETMRPSPIQASHEIVVTETTSDQVGVVTVVWIDPNETPLQKIERLEAHCASLVDRMEALEAESDTSQRDDSITEALDQVRDALSYAESAESEASRTLDYLRDAESTLENIS